MAKTSPGEFVRQVRQEAGKVTWPSRRETATSTAMVMVMVVLAAVFFFVIDQALATIVQFVLGFGA